MNLANPVVTTLAIFVALFGGGAVWGFLSTFVNRRADLRERDARSQKTIEETSAAFRQEVRAENASLKQEIRDMKDAFIPLIDVLDDLLPKMIECLTNEDKLNLRASVNKARRVT